MKSNKKWLYCFFSCLIILISSGCSSTPTVTNGNESIAITLSKTSIGQSGDHVEITITTEFEFSGYHDMRLYITKVYPQCTALDNPNFYQMLPHQTQTVILPTSNYIFACSGPGAYRIQIKADDGGQDISSNIEVLTIGGGGSGNNERAIKLEYDYQSGKDYWSPNSANNTFEESNVSVTYTDGELVNRNFTFDVANENLIPQQVSDRVLNPTSIRGNIMPYYLIFGNKINITNGSVNAGYANAPGFDPNYLKYSIVCYGKIQDFPTIYPTTTGSWNFQSVANWASAHELIHQVADIWGADLHTNHGSDPGSNYCVGNGLNAHIAIKCLEENTVSTHYVCERHRNLLYSNLPSNPDYIQGTGESNYKYRSENLNFKDSSLIISLEKNTFKKFEPILTLLKYTNRSNVKDTLFNLFNDYADEYEFVIEDQNRKVYRGRNKLSCLLNLPIPSTTLLPNESISMSISMNDFGDWLPYKNYNENEFYFDNKGYLSPGNYKAYLIQKGGSIWNRDKELRKSNEISFVVTEINELDKKILNLERNKNYSEILSKYSDHPYSEHVFAEYLNQAFPLDKGKIKSFSGESILTQYLEFFEKYPKSLYNYNYNNAFINSMFIKLYYKNYKAENIIINLNSILNSNSFVLKYLSNDISKKLLQNTIKKVKEDDDRFEMKR